MHASRTATVSCCLLLLAWCCPSAASAAQGAADSGGSAAESITSRLVGRFLDSDDLLFTTVDPPALKSKGYVSLLLAVSSSPHASLDFGLLVQSVASLLEVPASSVHLASNVLSRDVQSSFLAAVFDQDKHESKLSLQQRKEFEQMLQIPEITSRLPEAVQPQLWDVIELHIQGPHLMAIQKQIVRLIASGDLRSAVETAVSHKGSQDIQLAKLWSDIKTLTMLHLDYVPSNHNLQHQSDLRVIMRHDVRVCAIMLGMIGLAMFICGFLWWILDACFLHGEDCADEEPTQYIAISQPLLKGQPNDQHTAELGLGACTVCKGVGPIAAP
mmetsp:Transcript_20520/g.61770  ORF Transcript_20520/g.61770 Transcript_20520/m.61770 type:complete len:328 (-) Transcript_20520:547-1530(-)